MIREKHTLLSGGKFALGLFFGILVALIFYLIFSYLKIDSMQKSLSDLLPETLSAIVALMAVTISYRALSEQTIMRQAGTDPVLIAHLTSRDDEPRLIRLSVTNVGAGVALNTHIEVNNFDYETPDKSLLTNLTTIHNLIRAILQNSSVSYNLGISHKLISDPPLPQFNVKLTFDNIEGKQVSENFVVDIRELNNQPADSPRLTVISRDIEKLRKSIESIANGSKPLQVVHQTKSEKIKADNEQREELAAFMLEQRKKEDKNGNS